MVNEDFLISYWTLAFSNALWVLSKTRAVDPVPYKAEFAPGMYELLLQEIPALCDRLRPLLPDVRAALY